MSEVSQQEMENNIEALKEINAKANELERTNQLLKAKYDNDEKYVRLHKRNGKRPTRKVRVNYLMR